MAFKNPWGPGSPNFDRWMKNDWGKNPWGEGGKYHNSLEHVPNTENEAKAEFELPIIIMRSVYDQPNENNEDYLGEELLLRLADITIPAQLREDLELAMTMTQDPTLSFAVFDQFDLNVRERFGSDQQVIIEFDSERKTHSIIGYEFMAALLKGTEGDVTHTRDTNQVLIQPNVLRKNYEIRDESDIGIFRAVNYPVPLYQPEFQPAGSLTRTASYLRVIMAVNGNFNRNITVKLHVGEILQ